MCSCVCVYPVSTGLTLLRMLGLHQLKGPGVIQSEYWGLTSQISKVLPARVLGFFASRSIGGCFSSWSAGVLPDGVLGFYQPECWGFTRRSAGVLPAGVLRFFTSRSDGVLPAGVLGFLPAGVLGFYQPECWSFTSQSARVLPAGVLGCFIQPERWGCYQPECWGYLPARMLGCYQPDC